MVKHVSYLNAAREDLVPVDVCTSFIRMRPGRELIFYPFSKRTTAFSFPNLNVIRAFQRV